MQNEVLKWDGKVREVADDIRDAGSTLSQVRAFIDQLRTPFGFLSREVEKMEKDLRQADREAIEAEKQPDHKYYDKEMQAVEAFDKTLGGLANKYGYDVETIPWLNVTKAAVWILLVLVLLQMLKRPCVISLTVASTALYVLEFPSAISRQTFRGFVLLLVISWAYDFLTLFFIESSASEEDEEDG